MKIGREAVGIARIPKVFRAHPPNPTPFSFTQYLLVSTDEGVVKSLHEASRANPSPTALDGLLFALGLAGGRLRSREERRAAGAAARRLALPALVAWNLHAALPLALRGACADCPPGELLAAVDDDLARAQPPATALALALGSGPAAAIRLAKALSEAGVWPRWGM